MAYTRDFDTSLPVTHTQNKLWPEKARNIRTDLGERLAAILYGFTAGELDTHIGIKLGRLITIGTGAPSAPTGTDSAAAFDIYARADGTGEAIELWGIGTGSPNEIQFSKNGKIPNASLEDGTPTKTGDWILSTVTTARTGWTNVSATYSNKFMRINATPLTTGGADTHTQILSGASGAGGSHHHTGGSAGGVIAVTGNAITSVGIPEEHTHAAGTYAISTGDNVPAYVTAKCCQVN